MAKKLRPIDVPRVNANAVTRYHTPGYVTPEVYRQLTSKTAPNGEPIEVPSISRDAIDYTIHTDDEEGYGRGYFKAKDKDLD
jgi:hypothetical protein